MDFSSIVVKWVAAGIIGAPCAGLALPILLRHYDKQANIASCGAARSASRSDFGHRTDRLS